MSEKKKKKNLEELNFIEAIIFLWNSKFKIISFTLTAVIIVWSILSSRPNPDFESITQIKYISAPQAEKYALLNNILYNDENEKKPFFEITGVSLLNTYLSVLESVEFQNVIKRVGLLDPKDYISEEEFDSAVIRLASRLKLEPPTPTDGKYKGPERRFWELQYKYNDLGKYKEFLSVMDKVANETTRLLVKDSFENRVNVAEQKQIFQIIDLDTSINNSYLDYETAVGNKLVFLREQAKLARELNVAKYSFSEDFLLDTEFETKDKSLAFYVPDSLGTKQPFYLHGYEAIENEISIIEMRKNGAPFINSLTNLNKRKRLLTQDKTIARAKSAISLSPIINKEEFQAAQLNIETTTYSFDKKRRLLLLIAAIIGGIIGVIYSVSQSYNVKTKD